MKSEKDYFSKLLKCFFQNISKTKTDKFEIWMARYYKSLEMFPHLSFLYLNSRKYRRVTKHASSHSVRKISERSKHFFYCLPALHFTSSKSQYNIKCDTNYYKSKCCPCHKSYSRIVLGYFYYFAHVCIANAVLFDNLLRALDLIHILYFW